MARRSAARKTRRTAAKPRQRRLRFPAVALAPGGRLPRRWYAAFRRAPTGLQVVVGAAGAFAIWLALNWVYQVVRKPSELYFPISGTLYRAPSQTWRAYESIFRKHATRVITPEFLAALAQVEGSGNPVVRTYWRWSVSYKPFEVYRPASSAVGMYQITDGTFARARRYCVHDHVAVEDGPWHDFRSCWFNSLYTRTIATHAVELTSAWLDRQVASVLARQRIHSAMLRQKQDLAAVIHLCGDRAGERYARRGLRASAGQRCADHDVRSYLAKVNEMKRVFARLGASDHRRAR